MEARRQSGLSLDAELENQIKNESSEVRAITGKSNGASPDPAFVAVQGSGSSSLHGGLCVPMRWLCFIDFVSCHSLLGAKITFWCLCIDWQNMIIQVISGWEHFAEPWELDWHWWVLGRCIEGQEWCRLVLENGRSASEGGQGICSDFLAALEGLWIFDLLHKISLRYLSFSCITNATKMPYK